MYVPFRLQLKFFKKDILHFGDNLHEILKPIFGGNIISLSSAEFGHRVVKVKGSLEIWRL